jgi:hypothetical protein
MTQELAGMGESELRKLLGGPGGSQLYQFLNAAGHKSFNL